MALSNKFGWIVLSTGNKSEISTGYCTLYGDMAGGFAVLKDVMKTTVYRLSEYVNRSGGRGENSAGDHRQAAFCGTPPRSVGHGFAAALRVPGPDL